MTTKYKIITGFLIMVLLLAVTVVLGYLGLQKSSNGFTEYRRLAILNTGMSDLGTAMNGASDGMRAFLSGKDRKDVEATKAAIAEGLKLLDGMEEHLRSDETRKLFTDLKRDIGEFGRQFDAIITGLEGSIAQYGSVMMPSVEKFMQGLASMSDQAKSVDNLEALFRVSRLWGDLLKQISSVSRFSATLSREDSDLVASYMTTTEASLQSLGQVLTTEGGRRTFSALNQAFSDMNEAFRNMDAQNAFVRSNVAGITVFITETRNKIAAFNAAVDQDMRTTGAANLKSNDDAQANMMITGGVGLLVGVIIAVLIVLGIMRVLGQMAAFAGAVAQGRFDHAITVREKGEIGAMITALREIPAVLGRVISDAQALSGAIRRGNLRERFDVTVFSGSFAQLSQAVNAVSDAYTTIIDAMPTPMLTANKDGKALFFNTAGTAVAGEGLVGHPCREALNSEACSNQDCFGRRAMQNNAPASGETQAVHGGIRKVFYATAMPLHDENGAVTGYMEVVTDLTELKEKESTMRQVAQQASEIADRVAAAAEELAAQVEQISRGAEVQRSRVESTASAMNEMTATVTEVAQSAGRASGQSEDTRAKAEEGAGLVNEVVSSINAVNAVGLSLQRNMQELGTQAEGVGGVMNVISDIADQTNLLALNAAIEAARAGEAGRGFAVVADEVRKLAEKTMAATHEVGGSIDAIQHSTKMNIGSVEDAVSNVGHATELANASGTALGEIVELASVNSDIVASIATAAEEQSATSEEINKAVDEISRITGETADGMVQSSEAVQELSRMAQELKRVMEGLR